MLTNNIRKRYSTLYYLHIQRSGLYETSDTQEHIVYALVDINRQKSIKHTQFEI